MKFHFRGIIFLFNKAKFLSFFSQITFYLFLGTLYVNEYAIALKIY